MQRNKNNNNKIKFDIPDELWDIYKRAPESRTQNNINYLFQECKKLDCFKNVLIKYDRGQLMLREILSRVEFSIINQGKKIYSINEPIINMFYIFEGEVNIYRKQIFNEIEKKSLYKKFSNSNVKINSEKYNNIREIDYTLSKGEEYGKEDIKKEKREIEVESNTRCIIGFLSTQDWILIFEKTNLLEKNDTINFLSKINIFKDTNQAILNHIVNKIKIKKILKNEYLVKKGEPFENIYLIRYGSFSIYFNTKIKITINYDLDNFQDKNKRSESAGNKIDQSCTDNLQYKIISLFPGEFIGDIEYYLGKEKYILYAKCLVEDSQIIEINRKTFDKICNKRIKYIFLKEIKNKIDYYENRCKEIRKVNKNNYFGLKNKYKLMIIKNLEENNKDMFDKIEPEENKIKFRNKLNDKKFNTLISSFNRKNSLLLTDTKKNNFITSSLFFDKINKNKKNNNCLNYNILRTQSFNNSSIKLYNSNNNKNLQTNLYNNIINSKNKTRDNSKKKIKKELHLKDQFIITLINRKLKEFQNNSNGVISDYSYRYNKNELISKNQKMFNNYTNTLPIEGNKYNFNNAQNYPDINNNNFINKNFNTLKSNLNTISSYQHKKK